MFRVHLGGSVVQRRADESVLDALLRGGVDVPFSCRKGSCQTCLLRAVEGDPGSRSTRGLHPALVESGHFKPCVSRPAGDLVLAPADLSRRPVRAVLAERHLLCPGVVRLRLELETAMHWVPGQHVRVHHPGGAVRPYAITSVGEEDWFLELHVRLIEGGLVSGWLTRGLAVGESFMLEGPLGSATWSPAEAERPLLLVGEGIGVPALAGIGRAALRGGHAGLVLVSTVHPDRVACAVRDSLASLVAAAPEQVKWTTRVRSEEETQDVFLRTARAAMAEAATLAPLTGWTVVTQGESDVVEAVRIAAVEAGVPRAHIIAEPYASAHPEKPQDDPKLAGIRPDPELWEALGDGRLLREVLEDFYGRVYEDERLAPFFHNVTKQRAVDKQYAFLRDLFSGSRDYFGLKPFNAHHWMVISDELFDYREALFEECVRRAGLPEAFIGRWNALHELFRREIVKDRARGMIVDGREVLHEGYAEEELAMDCVCDGCGTEMRAGTLGRMHRRTGQLFCGACQGRPSDA